MVVCRWLPVASILITVGIRMAIHLNGPKCMCAAGATIAFCLVLSCCTTRTVSDVPMITHCGMDKQDLAAMDMHMRGQGLQIVCYHFLKVYLLQQLLTPLE